MWRRKGPNRTGLRRQLRTARVLFDTGDHEAAEVLLRRLLPDCEAELGANHEETIGLLNLLGSTRYQQRKASASAQIAREATDRAARACPTPPRPSTALTTSARPWPSRAMSPRPSRFSTTPGSAAPEVSEPAPNPPSPPPTPSARHSSPQACAATASPSCAPPTLRA